MLKIFNSNAVDNKALELAALDILDMKIPKLNFDSSWDVRIIPPFAGALIVFMVSKGDECCCVYLHKKNDFSWPYWEVLSDTENDYWIAMDNVEKLIDIIKSIVDGDDE